MSNIDWGSAPEWATHAIRKTHEPNKGSVHWSVVVDGEHKTHPNGSWFHPNGYDVVQERPRNPEQHQPWNGEGLPPVGLYVEFASHRDKAWRGGVILYASSYTCVIRADDQGGEFVAHPDTLMFRTARTPEQIAAQERIASAYSMCAIARSLTNVDGLALYDAGYRKQGAK